MSDYIVCCNCKSVPKYVKTAAPIELKKRGLKVPRITPQTDVHQLLWSVKKNSEGYRLLEGFMKRKGKFAFYVSLDDDGKVLETIDLLKGMK